MRRADFDGFEYIPENMFNENAKAVGRQSRSGLLRRLESASVTLSYLHIHEPVYYGRTFVIFVIPIIVEGEVDHLRMVGTFQEREALVIGEVGRATRREKPAHRRSQPEPMRRVRLVHR